MSCLLGRRWIAVCSFLALASALSAQGGGATLSGELRRWHTVTLEFVGPATSESAFPNPFLDYRLDVEFTHPKTGQVLRVPGFFAADGKAADTGAVSGDRWQVRFTPEERGKWHWSASFRTGAGVAVSGDPNAGTPVPPIDGSTGSFVAKKSNKSTPDLRARGRLRYVGEHLLVFAGTGEYFLKNGADSPENLLGYYEFDNTYDNGGLPTPGLQDGLHRYEAHVSDFDASDPEALTHTWAGGKGVAFLGMLDYLSQRGVNSVYFLAFNIFGQGSKTGDGQDTWPWLSNPGALPTLEQMKRFDCSKLDQWERVFSHMDMRGIQLHVVTQEEEIDQVLDGGALGVTRKLYYRELVARFAHHLAVQWNIGEENTNTLAQRLAFADHIRALDAYEHPIAMHTLKGTAGTFDSPSSYYDGLFGDDDFEATSIQGYADDYNAHALFLRAKTAEAGRKWVVFGDEQDPAVDAGMGNLAAIRKAYLGNVLGGGGWLRVVLRLPGDLRRRADRRHGAR